MKTLLNLFPGLATAGLLGIIAAPAAAGRNLQMVVVAEQTGAMTAPALPTPEHPASYVAFDGGYIEAGDPIANLQPPAAADWRSDRPLRCSRRRTRHKRRGVPGWEEPGPSWHRSVPRRPPSGGCGRLLRARR